MAKNEIGQATTKAMATHFIKSLLSIVRISETFAPFTLRIPISLVRRFELIIVSPNSPRHEIRIASAVK